MLSYLFLETPTQRGYDILMNTIKDVQNRVKDDKGRSEEFATKFDLSSHYFELPADSESMEYGKQNSGYSLRDSKSDENILPSNENNYLKNTKPNTEKIIIKDLFTKFRNRALSLPKRNETVKDEDEYYDPGKYIKLWQGG